ncbi:unnamed protein product, partial [Phaeothamnion confervicola]
FEVAAEHLQGELVELVGKFSFFPSCFSVSLYLFILTVSVRLRFCDGCFSNFRSWQHKVVDLSGVLSGGMRRAEGDENQIEGCLYIERKELLGSPVQAARGIRFA